MRYILMFLCLLMAHNIFAADKTPQVRFIVKEFIVKGNNPLSKETVKKILDPYKGEHHGLNLIGDAANDLEEAIKDKGYSFHRVIIPPQKSDSGVIALKVVESALDQLFVVGNKHFSEKNILSSLPALSRGKALNTLEVARSIQIANEHPAKNIAVFLSNSQKPGKIDGRIETRDMRPYQLFASFANTGNSETGHTRLSMGFQHSNFLKLDHIITLSYTTSPDYWSDVRQYGINYRLPVYRLGAGISMFYTYSEVNQGKLADFFDVSGKGSFGGISFDYAFLPVNDYNHGIIIGLQDRLFENNTRFINTPIGNDVRSMPVSLRYNGKLEKKKSVIDFYLEYIKNIAAGDNNDAASYAASRSGADENWDLFKFGADIDISLPKQCLLRTGLSTQYSAEPLISGEQFGIGGSRSIRGFEERELSGENGYSINFEVWSPVLLHNIKMLGFLDIGQVNLQSPHPGRNGDEYISSFGLGLRWNWKSKLSVSVDAARVQNGAQSTKDGDEKIHFNLFCRF